MIQTPYLFKIYMIKTIKNLIWNKVITEGEMLDLGCGNGQDDLVAAEAGFRVTAVDKNIPTEIPINPNITFVNSTIQEFNIEQDKFDVIYADNSLPFITKEEAISVIEDAALKIKKDGILYFSLFGLNDAWAKDTKMNFWSRNEVEDFVLKLGLTIYKKVEEEGYSPTMKGDIKYWHIFALTLKK